MTTQTLFRTRSDAGEADLPTICDLLNACDAADKLDDNYSVEDLRTEFASPRLDPARDVRLWEDGAGRLIGLGQIWSAANVEAVQDAYLNIRVHPEARGNDLESEILAWGAERAREVGRERDKPVQLRSGSKDYDTTRLTYLEQQGFRPLRYFFK